jgi:hypothetical protein
MERRRNYVLRSNGLLKIHFVLRSRCACRWMRVYVRVVGRAPVQRHRVKLCVEVGRRSMGMHHRSLRRIAGAARLHYRHVKPPPSEWAECGPVDSITVLNGIAWWRHQCRARLSLWATFFTGYALIVSCLRIVILLLVLTSSAADESLRANSRSARSGDVSLR